VTASREPRANKSGTIGPVSAREKAAGERLSTTSLRDFGPPISEDRDYSQPSYRVTLSPDEAPIPVLLRHALTLIGIPHYGPGEKVEWWTTFTYRGYPCQLAHQKFGVRLWIGGNLTEDQAHALLAEIRNKLGLAVRTVEGLLAQTAGDILNAGNVTVVNQHRKLRHAYDYFRGRATNPDVVEDVRESGTSEGGGSWSSFRPGRAVMAMHAFHDLVAAITAFLSCLEHDLILALPFLDYDPAKDNLTQIIGDRWGEKWRRVVGHSDQEAVRLRERLAAVVERAVVLKRVTVQRFTCIPQDLARCRSGCRPSVTARCYRSTPLRTPILMGCSLCSMRSTPTCVRRFPTLWSGSILGLPSSSIEHSGQKSQPASYPRASWNR
jgi:hypothetical protein